MTIVKTMSKHFPDRSDQFLHLWRSENVVLWRPSNNELSSVFLINLQHLWDQCHMVFFCKGLTGAFSYSLNIYLCSCWNSFNNSLEGFWNTALQVFPQLFFCISVNYIICNVLFFKVEFLELYYWHICWIICCSKLSILL